MNARITRPAKDHDHPSATQTDQAAAAGPAFRVPVLAWALLLGVCVVWFVSLGLRHLLPSDEGRYAEIAREMVATGDWVTIRYNGLKYFEKPPFHLWATALAYEAFGIGDWQARLWGALAGLGGVALAAWTALRWYGVRVALLTACVLIAAPAWNIASHFNSLDIGVAFALTGVLAGLLIAQHPSATAAQRRHWMWFAWLAMGIAVLSKGLIGIVLPALALVVYTVASRDLRLWRRLHIVSGTLLMLLVTAPWFVLVSLRNPEFPQFFFIHEHWQRFTSNVHHRSGPWWYFVPQLLLGFLPWLGLLPGMVRAIRREDSEPAFRPALFLAIWAAAIFVFFSASGSKLPGYIIPVYPALAILAAIALDGIGRAAWGRHVVAMLALMTTGLLATPLLARLGTGQELAAAYQAYVPWVAAACGLGIAALAAALLLNRGERTGSIVAYAFAFFALVTVALLGHENFGRNSSGVALAARIRPLLEPGMPIYSVRLLDHTIPFYLRRTTVMVEKPDELDFGTQQEPDKWLPTLAAFERAWGTPQHAVAIMSHETYTVLHDQGVPMFALAQDARRVVVTNFEQRAP